MIISVGFLLYFCDGLVRESGWHSHETRDSLQGAVAGGRPGSIDRPETKLEELRH
jgi:hypothetical protein